MMRRGGVVLAGVLAFGVLGPACAPSEKDPLVTLTAAEPHINDAGASTLLTITVLDEAAQKGTGVVRVTTKVGMFGEEGNNTLVTLSDGSATVPFTCPAARDSTCAQGVASISADWRGNVGRGKVYVGEKGLLLMQGKTGTTLPPPTSGGGNPTETGTFSSFTPSQVYLYGSLSTTSSTSPAISSLSQPMKLFIGFPNYVITSRSLMPNGQLLYAINSQLRVATQDEFVQVDTGTGYPAKPADNDTILTTSCSVGMLSTYSVHPVTGEVLYQCNGHGGEIRNQTTGQVVVPADSTKNYIFLKAGYGGTKLVTVAGSNTTLYLLDANNVARRVDLSSNPNTAWMSRGSARAKPDGFQFVYFSGDVMQLWHLSNGGTWTGVGVYPSPSKLPTGYSMVYGYFRLDGSNNAYALVSSSNGKGVARFSLGSTAPTIVYEEANRPADAGFNHWPPRLYNMINVTLDADLVTGP